MLSQIGLLLVVGVLAGILGSILGIGGGIILTPFLTLVMGLDIQYAIAASIVCVIATSSGATIAYLKDDMLNLRVAMFLDNDRSHCWRLAFGSGSDGVSIYFVWWLFIVFRIEYDSKITR